MSAIAGVAATRSSGGRAHTTAAWHYVLAQMLTGDQFANAAGGNKQYHHRMFFEILGVNQRQDDRLESREQAT